MGDSSELRLDNDPNDEVHSNNIMPSKYVPALIYS